MPPCRFSKAYAVATASTLDRFAIPLCAAHLNIWRFAAIDCTPLTHHVRDLQLP